MTRELQLRDKEILDVFEALAPYGELETILQEVTKRCDCSKERIDEAIRRIKTDAKHIYWRTI